MIDIKIGSIATGATVISRMLYQVRSTRPTRDQHLKTPAIPLEMQPETDEAKAAFGFDAVKAHEDTDQPAVCNTDFVAYRVQLTVKDHFLAATADRGVIPLNPGGLTPM